MCQAIPLPIVSGVAHGIAELEVESGRCLLGGIDPVADGLCAVPAFTNTVGWIAVFIVKLCVGAVVAFHHIITEAHIAKVFKQHLQIGLHGVLHVRAGVVEVAHAVPAFTGVLITKAYTKTVGFCFGLAIVVVRANISGTHGVGDSLVSFCWEAEPAVVALAMVDDDVGDGADTIIFKDLDEIAQLLFGTK